MGQIQFWGYGENWELHSLGDSQSVGGAHKKRERRRDPFIEREMDAMDDFRALFMPRQRQLPDVKREERVPCNGRGASQESSRCKMTSKEGATVQS